MAIDELRRRIKATMELRRWSDARGLLLQALTAEPDDPGIYRALAATCFQLKDFLAAQEYARAAIHHAPDHSHGHYWLGMSLISAIASSATQKAEASAAASDALRLAPEDADIFELRGLVAELYERPTEALQFYTDGLRCDPDHNGCWRQCGRLEENAGRRDAAESIYRELLRQDPEDGIAHRNLARVLLPRGEFEAAFAHIQSARRLRPQDAKVHELFEAILPRQKRWLRGVVWLYGWFDKWVEWQNAALSWSHLIAFVMLVAAGTTMFWTLGETLAILLLVIFGTGILLGGFFLWTGTLALTLNWPGLREYLPVPRWRRWEAIAVPIWPVVAWVALTTVLCFETPIPILVVLLVTILEFSLSSYWRAMSRGQRLFAIGGGLVGAVLLGVGSYFDWKASEIDLSLKAGVAGSALAAIIWAWIREERAKTA